MATFTKLKSGEWGIRVEGTARAGDKQTVTKKDKTTQSVTVDKVIWTGNGITLCSIVAEAKSSSSARPGCCAKCGGSLSTWEKSHGIRCCVDCRDGGGNARGGMSYRDRNGNFVLGDDD